jgi:hypothetical protein
MAFTKVFHLFSDALETAFGILPDLPGKNNLKRQAPL